MQNTFNTERYVIQKDLWPQSGRHILAQYTDDAILVYQAYNNQIADYALQHQKLGGPHWSSTRMSWIKTNFLWMMFRSNWGTKKNQDRILGIWLKRSSFEKYIAMVYSKDICSERGTVRIQWDPDHYPSGERHPFRKAIQIGLKNVQSFVDGEDIVQIQDLTDFVRDQYKAVKSNKLENLITPEETVYPYHDEMGEEEEEQDGDGDDSVSSKEESLRVTLSYKGKQKVVVLFSRNERELVDLVIQKFKYRPKQITLSAEQVLTPQLLKNLSQGATLTIV